LLLSAVLTTNGVIAAGQPPADQFFIISSVDPAKHELLVKEPTEVTQLMRVDDETKYFDRQGNPATLSDLRAGDTVFVTSSPKTGVAREIRKGPMTVNELQRRYLRSKS
jgi:hypothetical protein